jgi:hypothetical protein
MATFLRSWPRHHQIQQRRREQRSCWPTSGQRPHLCTAGRGWSTLRAAPPTTPANTRRGADDDAGDANAVTDYQLQGLHRLSDTMLASLIVEANPVPNATLPAGLNLLSSLPFGQNKCRRCYNICVVRKREDDVRSERTTIVKPGLRGTRRKRRRRRRRTPAGSASQPVSQPRGREGAN